MTTGTTMTAPKRRGRRSLALALVFLATWLWAMPASAHNGLDVGFNETNDMTTPASAAISNAGTAASGNYTFLDGNIPKPLPPATTDYSGVRVFNTSTLNISGGQIAALITYGGTTTITGGDVVRIVGDTYYGTIDGTVNFIGTNLAFNKTTISGPGGLYNTITGDLPNNSTFSTEFFAASYGIVEFNGVVVYNNPAPPPFVTPEASSAFSFGLLLALGLGGVVLMPSRRALLRVPFPRSAHAVSGKDAP